MKQNGLVADYRAKMAEIIRRTTEDLKPKIATLTSKIEQKTMWILRERTSFDKPSAPESEIIKIMEEISILRTERDTLKLQTDRQDEVKTEALAGLNDKYLPMLTDSVNGVTPQEAELAKDIAMAIQNLQKKVFKLATVREKKNTEYELFRKITKNRIAMDLDINEELKRAVGMTDDLHPLFSKFLAMFIRDLSDKNKGLYGVQIEDRTHPPPELTKEEKATARAKNKQTAKDSTKRRAKGARVYTENPKLGEDMSTGKGF